VDAFQEGIGRQGAGSSGRRQQQAAAAGGSNRQQQAEGRKHLSLDIGHFSFANSIWKCNGTGEFLVKTIVVIWFVFIFISLAVGAVGTVGNSTFFGEFSKRCGNGGKRSLFSTVSTARQFPQPGLACEFLDFNRWVFDQTLTATSCCLKNTSFGVL
jgi:preprotein translocase subunit SecG